MLRRICMIVLVLCHVTNLSRRTFAIAWDAFSGLE